MRWAPRWASLLVRFIVTLLVQAVTSVHVLAGKEPPTLLPITSGASRDVTPIVWIRKLRHRQALACPRWLCGDAQRRTWNLVYQAPPLGSEPRARVSQP